MPALGGGSFLPEARALFARMSPTPTYARKILINRAIAALIRGGVWSKLDVLYVFAADVTANALLNWKGSSNACTSAGASFTADRGYTGDGASTYLTPDFTPGGGQFIRNDHSFGRWTRTLGVSAGAAMGADNGSAKFAIRDSSSTQTTTHDGANTDAKVWTANAVGHALVSRTGSTSYDAYRNGASLGTYAEGSEVISGFGPFFILAERNSVGSAVSFSDSQITAAHFGKGLAAAEALALYSALAGYMTGVGA